MRIRSVCLFLFFCCELCFSKQKKSYIDEVLDCVSRHISIRCMEQETVAILDFDAKTLEMTDYINSQLISGIFENSKLQIVTRQHMDKVEQELKFQSSGMVSDSTALSIGDRLGAYAIVFGELEELDNKYLLQVKMINVKTGSYALFKKYEITRSSKTEQLLHHAATIYKSSLGVILEANRNSVSHISPSAGISFDYSILRRFSIVLKMVASYDLWEKDDYIYTVEPIAFLRIYTVSPTGEPSTGLFIEAQVGPELLFINSNFKTVISAGCGLGFRVPVTNFYFEPFLRAGYPYILGVGINSGFRF